MSKTLPAAYQWLNKVAGLPKELSVALKLFGVLEVKGKGSNSTITGWAKEVGVKGWYPDDSVPWCGLFKGYCAKLADWLKTPKYDLLSALSWLAWGVVIEKGMECLGDTLVFSRPGGGHVGYYIGEDKTHFCVFGGNQADSTSFTWIEKTRLMGVRRAPFKVQPEGVKKIMLNRSGEPVSQNEC